MVCILLVLRRRSRKWRQSGNYEDKYNNENIIDYNELIEYLHIELKIRGAIVCLVLTINK
jgi:hypothetical protein